MPVSPWNKKYFEVYGTFSGSTATTFEVKVTGNNGSEAWKYRSRDTDGGEYSAYSSTTTIAVDTGYQLGSTGVYVKFTRASATSYTSGDAWVFSTNVDVKLDDSIEQFDHIQTIDIEDNRNLLAISSTTGRVATIEDIDTTEPKAVDTELSIGAITPGHILDFEKKNKELYIAKGRESNPQFLGYSKNNGFEGVGDTELRSNPAIDVLEGANNPNTDAYDMSVVLRAGGGANTADAKIAVGINNVSMSGTIKNGITIQNLIDDKLYEYGSLTTPIAIKRWYGKMHGSYCDGFSVLRKPELGEDYAGTIDLWSLNTALGGTIGQQANMYCTIHLKRPDNSDKILEFGDFYIVPETSEFAKWYIVVAKNRSRCRNFNVNDGEGWLYRTSSISTANLTDGKIIGADDYEDITPSLFDVDGSPSVKNGNEMYWMQKVTPSGNVGPITAPGGTSYTADMPDFVMIHASHYTGGNMTPKITETTEYRCLSFAGFNSSTGSYGKSPILSFTGKIGPSLDKRANKNWYQANSCLTSVAQKQIITGVSVNWNDPTAHSMPQWTTDAFGPFMSNNAGNTNQINYRPVNWCTWMIEIDDDNTGRGKYKSFPHMLDWNEQGTLAKKYRTFKGSQTFSIPNWVTSIENESGEGEQQKQVGTVVNKGIIKLGLVPSKSPNFGYSGSIFFSTIGTKRHRHLLSYVRPGNRAVYTFRFGLESNTPQSLSDVNNPMLFPNSWDTSNGNVIEPDYQSVNAYALWNEDDTASAFPISYYDTAAKSLLHKRYRSIPVLGSGGDDKHGYRPAEHGNITQDVTGGTTQWYPQATDKFHIFGVKYGDNEQKARYRALFTGTAGFTNEYTSSVSEFAIATPTESGTANSWAGPTITKAFYKASLIYDGYQETPLLSTPNSFFKSGGIDQSIDVEIKIKDSYPVSERVTGVALYRASSVTTAEGTDPDSLYRFISEIPLFQFNHSEVNGHQSFTVRDTGDAEGTYESINGLSENIYDLGVNYSVNAQQNGYHFIGNCKHSQIADAENYLFRSQPGKFAIFDWTKDFIELPFIPTALIGFMGKVYAFSNNQCAIVNPENLFVEDVIDGIGCINSKSTLVTDAGLMWCDYRNIYLASPKIRPIGNTILSTETDGWLNLSLTEKEGVRMGYDSKRKAFLLFYTRGTTHRCWAFSTQKGRWDLFETPNKVMDTALTKDGSTILLLADNKLAKFLSHTSIRKDWEWSSKRISMGDTMVDKKVRNIKIEGDSKSLTSLYYKIDGDTAWKSGVDVSDKFTGNQNRAITLQTADKSKKLHWIKLKIQGDNTSVGSDAKVFATSVIYKAKRPK
tara:strand:- start:9701 stop:13657 length:3957 start_codon:yes stop_codon:yes gene_type:complete